jgi:hypothetical protein
LRERAPEFCVLCSGAQDGTTRWSGMVGSEARPGRA